MMVTSDAAQVLRAKNVTKRFGGLVAVHDVNFSIPQGSIVSLIGPNGAGKTTFFNIIAGIYDPTEGAIEFRGRDMIARARRAWLEPVMWLLFPAIIGIGTFVLGPIRLRDESVIVVGIFLTVMALMTNMLIGVDAPADLRPAARRGSASSAAPGPTTWSSPASAEPSRTSGCSRT